METTTTEGIFINIANAIISEFDRVEKIVLDKNLVNQLVSAKKFFAGIAKDPEAFFEKVSSHVINQASQCVYILYALERALEKNDAIKSGQYFAQLFNIATGDDTLKLQATTNSSSSSCVNFFRSYFTDLFSDLTTLTFKNFDKKIMKGIQGFVQAIKGCFTCNLSAN